MARRPQIDAPIGEDLGHIVSGQHSDQSAGDRVPEVMGTYHDAAHTHDRGHEDIEKEVLWPKKPKSRHQ